MVHFSSALALLACAAVPAQTQLRITEILVDPVGSNAGRQVIEITNDWNGAIDLTGWHVAFAGLIVPLPGVVLPGGQIARLHLGVSGITNPADIFMPNVPTLSGSDTFTLLTSGNANDPTALIDFVSWGAGSFLIQQAVTAGQWSSTLVSAPNPPEGATLAHFGAAAFGTQSEPSAWYVDRSPTLGLSNDNASIFGMRSGCVGAGPYPSLGLAREESRPWIGERFELDAFNFPLGTSLVVLVIGARPTPPVLLDPIGMPTCALHVATDVVVGVSAFAGQATFVANVPLNARLIRAELHMQAFVPWAGAPNPIQAYVTNSVVGTIGGR